LWETLEAGVDVARLERAASETLSQWRKLCFDEAQAAHALGSGSLLVRTGDDTFGFIHSSVMEYLVAAQAAERLTTTIADAALVDDAIRRSTVLADTVLANAAIVDEGLLALREMSPLMADFFCGVAGREAASAWARAVTVAAHASPAAKANALAVSGSLGIRFTGVDLAGQDLREQDLTDRDLASANLTGANLAGARTARHEPGRRLLGQRRPELRDVR
jgi:uncharacterized protein YjbI with pentapeptide repeats